MNFYFRSIDGLKLCCLAALLCIAFVSPSLSQDGTDPTSNALALFNKGQDAHEKGELKAAIDLYESALRLLPEFPEAELQRGNALFTLGKISESETAFRRAVELRDDWSLAYASLGRALVTQSKFAEAKAILAKAIELDEENIPAWVATAELATRLPFSDIEIRTLHKKISSFSSTARPTVNVLAAKASLEHALKDDKASALSAERVLASEPKNLPMIHLLADIALKTNDLQKADELIRRIEAIDKAAPELPVMKVRSLLAAGKTKEASELIASVKDPSKELLDIKSQIAASTEADIPALEKRLETNARDIVALSRLCTLLRRSDPMRAVDFCRRAADVEPNNIDHAIGFGAALLQAKLYPQASALFQKLVGIAPENYTLRANFGSALFQQKRYTEAKVQFTWLSERQPSNAITYFFLAIANDELGLFADAMANYQLFLKHVDPALNQLEIDKVNLRLPTLQRQLDAGKGKSNAKPKSND